MCEEPGRAAFYQECGSHQYRRQARERLNRRQIQRTLLPLKDFHLKSLMDDGDGDLIGDLIESAAAVTDVE